MGVYVNYKCRSCGRSLSHGYVRSFAGIGEPLVQCARCKEMNSIADRVNEWQLMGASRKTWLIITLSWSTLFYFGAGSVLVGAILLGADIISPEGLLALCLISLVFGFLRLFSYFRRGIRLSNARMNDPAYRAKLRNFGVG